MQATLSQAIESCLLDLNRFLEVWPLVTNRDLLQALEACSGKRISFFAAGDGPGRIEILADCDAGRAAVDNGSGARWGAWQPSGSGACVVLDDHSGEWQLSALTAGATVSWAPAAK
jgi:hypothetical protein